MPTIWIPYKLKEAVAPDTTSYSPRPHPCCKAALLRLLSHTNTMSHYEATGAQTACLIWTSRCGV
jgi:hypothetical protein